MDQGPFRMPQSADKAGANKPESTDRPDGEPEPIRETPRPSKRPTTNRYHHEKDDKSKKWIVVSGIVVAVVIVAIVIWSLSSGGKQSSETGIDTSKYQAIFLANGQTYFGKLQAFNDGYMKLTDIFYPQTTTTQDDTKSTQKTDDQNNVQLIKLGDEIHGPEDEMIVSKDQILFFENLKKDGKVSKSIEEYKKSK